MDYSKRSEGIYAEIRTSKGTITAILEHARAPLTVASFVGLAEGKIANAARPLGTAFYDGLVFHRAIPQFMVQTGDPDGNGRGGPGYRFQDEFDTNLRYTRPGILGMANAGPNTNGSQFFITLKATPILNNKHTVFGHVVHGQSVVATICEGDCIETLRIVRVGAEFQSYGPPDIAKYVSYLQSVD